MIGKLFGDRQENIIIDEAARRGNLVVAVSATGTLEPLKKVDVGIEVSGTIKSVDADYNAEVADLVSYLQYMGEPVAQTRKQLGVYVLLFLAGFFVLAYALKREFWKDIH